MQPVLTLLDGIRWHGASVVGDRRRMLLATLVAHARDGLTDDSLITELWGEAPPTNPAKALQVVVSRTRAATRADVIARTRHGYRLGLSDDEVDVLRLVRLVDEARSRLDTGAFGDAQAGAEQAVRLADRHSAGGHDRLDDMVRGQLDDARRLLGISRSASGEHDAALALLETAVRQHPHDEHLLAYLLRSETAVRGAGAALDRYETYRAELADRVGIDPGPALRRLHGELLAADRPVREGIRFDSTALLGRDDDVRQLRGIVAATRVTTIVGAGGLGKTRLAHVLGREAEQPAVHLIELVGVGASEDVVGEIGSAIGVRDSVSGRRTLTAAQRADVRSRIAQQLDRASTLLILDNCEHVVDAVADLVAFLVASIRDLRVLITSRAPLNIAAERVYALGQLATSDAVELFRRRAAAARPGAVLNDAAAQGVVSRLDGLPLAIELAAAKVRVMSVEDIGKRLENRFALLRGGDRPAPDRHQTLLAVIDWSWNLLAESERDALRRLSVFQDGFTLEAAETVLAESGVDALDAVQSLVDQSLLTVRDAASSVRYGMLETVREFGVMQLLDAGADADALRAQREWARAYAAEAAAELFGRDEVAAIDALHAEETNLSDVLRRALTSRDPDTVVVLLDALGRFWSMRGEHLRIAPLVDAIEDTVDGWHPPPELADHARMAAANVLVNTSIAIGLNPAAVWKLLRGLGPGSSRPEVRSIATVTLAFHENDPEGNAARLARLCHDPDRRIAALALRIRINQLENSGDPAAAIEAATQALELFTDDDGPWQRAIQHNQLAQLQAQLGYLDHAAPNAKLALPVLDRIDATDDAIQLRGLLMTAAIAQGRFDEAERAAQDVASAQRRHHDFGGQVVVATSEAELALARGQYTEGLRRYRLAVERMRALRLPGVGEPSGFEPWTLHGESAALAACAQHGQADDGVDLFDTLREKLPRFLDPSRNHIDFPVAGGIMFALSAWGLARAALSVANVVRLAVFADRFGYNRSVPTMALHIVTDPADRAAPGLLKRITAEYGNRRGPELLEEVRQHLNQLFG